MRHGFAQSRNTAAAGGQIDSDVELLATLPIVVCVAIRQHVDFGTGWKSQHRYERRKRRRAYPSDCLLVGCEQRALVQRHSLWPEKQLGGTQYERVLATVQRVAQDDVDKLVDK